MLHISDKNYHPLPFYYGTDGAVTETAQCESENGASYVEECKNSERTHDELIDWKTVTIDTSINKRV